MIKFAAENFIFMQNERWFAIQALVGEVAFEGGNEKYFRSI